MKTVNFARTTIKCFNQLGEDQKGYIRENFNLGGLAEEKDYQIDEYIAFNNVVLPLSAFEMSTDNSKLFDCAFVASASFAYYMKYSRYNSDCVICLRERN